MATPTRPLADAIAEYQRSNPYSQQAFEGLFTNLRGQGYNVARTTHAGNTLASNDALVDDQNNVYDLVFSSSEPGAKWVNNPAGTYDPSRKVVGPDGSFVGYDEWLQSFGGTPNAHPTEGAPGQAPAAPPSTLGQGGAPARWPVNPNTGKRQPPGTGSNRPSAVSGPPTASNPYDAANAAAARSRLTAQRGGRRSTIIAGFGAGSPSTRPATALGS